MRPVLETLIEGAKALEVDLDPVQVERFLLYLEEIERWNRRIALTGIRDREARVVKLFLDSIALDRWVPPGSVVADLGSGNGLPGIALKIIDPAHQLYLVESSRKKSHFLRHIVRHLNLSEVFVLNGRIEGPLVQSALKNGVNRVTARALGPLERWVESAIPLLQSDGAILWTLGRRWREAIEKVEERFPEWGVDLEGVTPYLLPFKGGERAVAVLRGRREERGARTSKRLSPPSPR